MQKFVQKGCAKKAVQKSCAKIVRMMTVHFLAGRENAAKKRMTEDCANTPATKLVDTPCWKPQCKPDLARDRCILEFSELDSNTVVQ